MALLSRRSVLLLLLALGGASLWYDRPSGAARKLWALTGLRPEEGEEGGARSLQALVRNVTTDMDELVALVEDFFDAQDGALADLLRDDDGDGQVGRADAASTLLRARVGKEAFRAFLRDKARSSYVSMERTLDYILGLYKFLFVVLLFDVLMPKGSARRGSAGAANGPDGRGSGGSTRADSESDFDLPDLGSSGRSLGSSGRGLSSSGKKKARGANGNGAHGREGRGKENLLMQRVSGAHDLAKGKGSGSSPGASGGGGKVRSRRALGSPRNTDGSPASVIDFNTYR
mmetsp:Transcript_14335/g.36143  ORF Transcript_14335/g.36143 Transcript_14335/m.36143 type:complete len:288 (-) Transcript_14335:2210-3073(-)